MAKSRLTCLLFLCAALFAVGAVAGTPQAEEIPVEEAQPSPPLISYLFGYGFILQIIALVHWARRGRDRFWIWIIIIGGFVGAAAYFVVEALPDFADMERSFKGPGRRRRIAALRALIQDNPSAGNYEELGELLIEEKKWKEARECFNKALGSRTDLVDTFYWRGVAAFELGDDAAAIPDLQHVVKVNPKFAYSRAQCLLGQALARSGRADDAEPVFQRLIESTTASESIVAAAEFFADRGREPVARELVERVLARRATMPSYQKRRDAKWLRKAKSLQRRLRKSAAAQQNAAA